MLEVGVGIRFLDLVEVGLQSAQRVLNGRDDPASRGVGLLPEAARTAVAASGVDVPAKEIAALAGVGVGTLYGHFPRRSELIVAVLESGVDACADAGPALSARHAPYGDARAVATSVHRVRRHKRGLATALHSGDPAFDALPGCLWTRLGPVLGDLLDAARSAGEIRADVSARDLLTTVALLCQPAPYVGPDYSQPMVGLLLDGLRSPEPERS